MTKIPDSPNPVKASPTASDILVRGSRTANSSGSFTQIYGALSSASSTHSAATDPSASQPNPLAGKPPSPKTQSARDPRKDSLAASGDGSTAQSLAAPVAVPAPLPNPLQSALQDEDKIGPSILSLAQASINTADGADQPAPFTANATQQIASSSPAGVFSEPLSSVQSVPIPQTKLDKPIPAADPPALDVLLQTASQPAPPVSPQASAESSSPRQASPSPTSPSPAPVSGDAIASISANIPRVSDTSLPTPSPTSSGSPADALLAATATTPTAAAQIALQAESQNVSGPISPASSAASAQKISSTDVPTSDTQSSYVPSSSAPPDVPEDSKTPPAHAPVPAILARIAQEPSFAPVVASALPVSHTDLQSRVVGKASSASPLLNPVPEPLRGVPSIGPSANPSQDLSAIPQPTIFSAPIPAQTTPASPISPASAARAAASSVSSVTAVSGGNSLSSPVGGDSPNSSLRKEPAAAAAVAGSIPPIPPPVTAALADPNFTAPARPAAQSSSSSSAPPDAKDSSGTPQALPEFNPTQAASAGHPGPVQMAQMVSKAAQSEMRIGLNTSAFGSVEVRAVVHATDIGVTIGSEKGDLRSLLANDLPGIAHTLQQHDLRLSEVSFHQQGFAFSSDSSAGGQAQPRSFAERRNPEQALPSDRSAAEPGAAPQPSSRSGGLRLSILA